MPKLGWHPTPESRQKMSEAHQNTPDDFWSRVNKNGPVHPILGTPCWLWTGALVEKGYGEVGYHGKRWYTHRLAYYLTHGEIPEDKDVCHHCDNPPCCNPEHLWADTREGNMKDAVSKGRIAHGSEHYAAKLTEANVAEIRKRVAAGEKQVALATEFGVSFQQISSIVSGKRWK